MKPPPSEMGLKPEIRGRKVCSAAATLFGSVGYDLPVLTAPADLLLEARRARSISISWKSQNQIPHGMMFTMSFFNQ